MSPTLKLIIVRTRDIEYMLLVLQRSEHSLPNVMRTVSDRRYENVSLLKIALELTPDFGKAGLLSRNGMNVYVATAPIQEALLRL